MQWQSSYSPIPHSDYRDERGGIEDGRDMGGGEGFLGGKIEMGLVGVWWMMGSLLNCIRCQKAGMRMIVS